MIISLLLKVLTFYILFLFIRGGLRAYKTYRLIKQGMNRGQGPTSYENGRKQDPSGGARNGDIEAEFRVIKEDE